MTIADFVTVEWAPASDPTSTTPTWVDITSIVQEVTVQGGRSGVFGLYGPRTATITCLNGTKAAAATFAIDGFYRWRQIRVMSGTGEWVFTGHILTMTHDQSNSPFSGQVVIECADKLGALGAAEFNDDAGQLINGVEFAVTLTEAITTALTQAQLDTTSIIFAGSTAFFKYPDRSDMNDSTTFPTGNILQWLQSVSEAEVGGVQIAADGTPVVTGRWQPFTAAVEPNMTFTDTTPGVGEYRYLREDLTFAATDSDYYNRGVAKSSLYDPVFEASNIPAGYPTETLSRTDLPFIYQSWAEANAALYTALYSQQVTYPRSLHVYASSAFDAQDVLPTLLSSTYQFGEVQVAVKHTPAGTGQTQKTYRCTIENVQHTITPTLWSVECGFGSLDRWIDAYGDGTDIYELVAIDGDAAHGIDSDAIIAP